MLATRAAPAHTSASCLSQHDAGVLSAGTSSAVENATYCAHIFNVLRAGVPCSEAATFTFVTFTVPFFPLTCLCPIQTRPPQLPPPPPPYLHLCTTFTTIVILVPLHPRSCHPLPPPPPHAFHSPPHPPVILVDTVPSIPTYSLTYSYALYIPMWFCSHAPPTITSCPLPAPPYPYYLHCHIYYPLPIPIHIPTHAPAPFPPPPLPALWRLLTLPYPMQRHERRACGDGNNMTRNAAGVA